MYVEPFDVAVRRSGKVLINEVAVCWAGPILCLWTMYVTSHPLSILPSWDGKMHVSFRGEW